MIGKRLSAIAKSIHKAVKSLIPWALLCFLITATGIGFRAYTVVTRVDRYATPEKVAEIGDSFVHSNDAAQITANAASEGLYTLQDSVTDHLNPTIDRAGREMSLTLAEMRKHTKALASRSATTIDITNDGLRKNLEALYLNQLAVNSALLSANQLIQSANGRLTAPEIDRLLEDLAATGHQVRLASEDPAIAEILASAAETTANVSGVTANLDHTTSTVDRYVEAKLFPPPPKGFWGKFKHGLKVAAEWVYLGAGAGYYVVRLAQ